MKIIHFRVNLAQVDNAQDAYSLGDMLSDLRAGVWAEIGRRAAIDTYRRNLQRAYLARVGALMIDEDAQPTDIVPFLRAELVALRGDIESGVSRSGDRATQVHLRDCLERIGEILDPSS